MVDTPIPSSKEKQEIFDEVARVLAMDNQPVNEQTLAHLKPLLDGSMNYEEHRKMLEAMIAELEA